MLRPWRHLVALIAVGAVVALCVAFLDRPLALWVNARLVGTTLFATGELVLRPLDGLAVAGLALLVIAVVWRRGFGAPPWVDRFVVGASGAAVALLGALVLKAAVGRPQISPSFLRDHVFGCRPFAGSAAFMAFPSATMAGAAAFVVGVGVHGRIRRAAAAVVLLSLAATLVVTASHWLSDIVGGTYLGAVSAAAVARLLGRRQGPQPDRRRATDGTLITPMRH